jgi:hypothetical protein
MSIAEKLTTVAENQQRVYDAGFKKAIERYAPEFAESGAVVECYPIEGFPLNVISQITPIQAGSGDASITNPRPITARTAVKVTVANDTESAEYNAELAEDAYCGSFDWSTGLLTLTHKMLTLTGNESWNMAGTYGVYNGGSSFLGDSLKGTSTIFGLCSHAPNITDEKINATYIRKANNSQGLEVLGFSNGLWGEDLLEITVDKWKAYIKAQYDSGTPVQILYQLEVPITVQLTPQEILALSGTNTIRSDTGNTTVTGKGDWTAMVANLATEADYQEALREMGVNV